MFKSTSRPGDAARAAAVEELAPERAATAERRDADGAVVDRALQVVRDFIRDRGLVLYGGQAIDYALRLADGEGIYPEHQRPDYDFYSPRNVDDAYDLAEMLADRGFPGVGVIRAIHVQTMRVRVDFVSVADVSYVPRAVFDRLPTVDFEGSRALHPDFQRLDMHLAFCFPFNGPPREDIFHRFAKDLRRFNRFEAAYPLAGTPAAGLAAMAKTAREAEVDLAGVALHGFAAYAAMLGALGQTLAAAAAVRDGGGLPDGAAGRLERLAADFRALPRLALEAPGIIPTKSGFPGAGGRARLRYEVPDWAEGCEDLVVVTPGGLPDAGARYRPLMDLRPASVRAGGVATYSTEGRLLAVSRVKIAGGAARATVPTAQYVLLYFLLESHMAASREARAHFRGYYAATLEVLRIAEAAFGVLGAAARGDAEKLLLASPFGLSVDTLGVVNENSAYLIRRAQTLQNRERACGPPARAEPLPDLDGVPQSYTPAAVDPAAPEGGLRRREKFRPAFDYAAAPGFDLDGGPCPGG